MSEHKSNGGGVTLVESRDVGRLHPVLDDLLQVLLVLGGARGPRRHRRKEEG